MSTDDKPQEAEEEWPQGLDDISSIKTQAYLVARGVRPMCLVGEVILSAKKDAAQVLHIVSTQSQGGGLATLIPFMVRRDGGDVMDDWYDVGFAKEPWVIDTFEWLCNAEVPRKQRNAVMGLLLGYAPDAIGHFLRKGVSVRD